MDLTTFRRLLTAEGQAALAAAVEVGPTEPNVLASLDRLRKRYDADLARAAVETVLLRDRARTKFARAAEMFFTRESLEQASGEIVANDRARRFAPFDPVADLGCGIGADAIALGLAGRHVTAFDTDPVRAAMAKANLRVYGLNSVVRCEDVLAADLSVFRAAFCDPARRTEGKRFLSINDYLPSPRDVMARVPADFPLAFKIAPGVRLDEIESWPGEREFLSVHGELKECVVWQGPFRTANYRATVLPGGESLSADRLPLPAEVTPIGAYYFVPDPAVVRARLDDLLAENLGLTRYDAMIAGLTGDDLVLSPFVTAYRVEAVLPFDPRKLASWLKSRGVGRVTPVKCGAKLDTDMAVKAWKLTGDLHRFVIFTRIGETVVAVVAERVDATGLR